jgi:hypothetical protein
MKSEKLKQRSRFIDRVSVYGLEFAVAMVTLIISASVLSFATFALCNYLANETVGSEGGYFALWSSASTIVWVPVAMLFYLRSRAYMAQHPDISSHPVQRVFTIIFQVLMILTIISFAVAAVFAGLTSLVEPDNTSNILLGVALPSAISALLFGGVLVSFFKQPVVRRRTFAVVFGLVSLAVVIPTIIVSVLSLRSVNADEYRETDLYAIKAAIDDFARDNSKTPGKLSDVSSLISDEKVVGRISDYEYTRVDDDRYRLCADFAAQSSYRSSLPVTQERYRTYASFSEHEAGKNCYSLRTSYSSSYDVLEQNDS